MSIEIEKKSTDWSQNWKKYFAIITGTVVIACFVGFSFMCALGRTIPAPLLQVDEEALRKAIVDIYEQPLSEGDGIVLREISRGRDLWFNRDYMEYDYEYVRDNICYTGQLTVCYEYDKKGWRLVSIGITKLKQKKQEI